MAASAFASFSLSLSSSKLLYTFTPLCMCRRIGWGEGGTDRFKLRRVSRAREACRAHSRAVGVCRARLYIPVWMPERRNIVKCFLPGSIPSLVLSPERFHPSISLGALVFVPRATVKVLPLPRVWEQIARLSRRLYKREKAHSGR